MVFAELLPDEGQLLLQYLAHPILHCVLNQHVEDQHIVFLADAVQAADALLQAHGIPGQVVVDHDVAELQVDALATGVGGYQELGMSTEGLAGGDPLLHLHLAVDAGHLVTTTTQGFGDVLLSGHELGEDQELCRRVALAAADLVHDAQQGLEFGVLPAGGGLLGQVQQVFDQGHLFLQASLVHHTDHGL